MRGSVLTPTYNPVEFIHQHNFWVVCFSFVFFVLGIAADDYKIADMHESGCGTIQTDDSGTSFSTDRVGGQPTAAADGGDGHRRMGTGRHL